MKPRKRARPPRSNAPSRLSLSKRETSRPIAINLIKHRLQNAYGESISKTYHLIGEPVTLDEAEQLAKEDPYQFQWWALGLVGARPTEQKKGADQGIDGVLPVKSTVPSAPASQV